MATVARLTGRDEAARNRLSEHAFLARLAVAAAWLINSAARGPDILRGNNGDLLLRGADVPDVVNVPGVKSAKRFKLLNAVENHEAVEAPWHSLALYEFETDDPLALAKELSTMAGSSKMPMTDSIDDVRIKIIGTFAKEA
jgi:hypothetical protein